MKFISLFSGIGGFDLGLERAGMKCAAQVEYDSKARDVLARHIPDADRSITDVKEYKGERGAADLVCGGFPCQDLSVAGARAGLAGERSGLWFEFARIIGESRLQWVLIENVPGLLSSNGGKDFAVILQGLVKFGYGVAWRILDSQYFGVAQRRRRVFIVGSLGDGRAAEVLFERESSPWDTAPSREAGERVAHAISASPTATGRLDPNGQSFCIPINTMAATRDENVTPPLSFGSSGTNQTPTVAYNWQSGGDVRLSFGKPSLQANQVPAVGVRRLTPTECERLQGFPDGWTDGQSDSTRYRQLGNAVTVNVIEWIGKRIIEANND